MNSKAIRKQLLAAVAMVLVAALALGSSTYAWFVSSGTVTAEGMKVQAESEAGMVIRYGTGEWVTNAVATKTESRAARLKPISTIDSKNWYHASAELPTSSGARQDSRTEISTNLENNYYLVEEFEIRSSSSSALVSGLYVKSVTATGFNNSPMNTALRVGIAYRTASNTTLTQDKTDKFRIFAPVVVGAGSSNEPDYTYRVYTGSGDATGTEVTALASTAGTPSNAFLVNSGVAIPADTNTGVKVQVYVWYEGEDHNLYSDNYVVDDINVTVEFGSISSAEADSAVAEAARNLTNATATETGKVTVNSVEYFPITGKSLNSAQLYTSGSAGPITSTSKIYTIDGQNVTEVTKQCIMPTGSAGKNS